MAGLGAKRPFTPSKGTTNSKRTPASKKKNHSILNFFQKTDGPPKPTSRQSRITQFTTTSNGSNGNRRTAPGLGRADSSNDVSASEDLFLQHKGGVVSKFPGDPGASTSRDRPRSNTPDDIWSVEEPDTRDLEDGARFNENNSVVKKRKVESSEEPHTDSPPAKQSGKSESGVTSETAKSKQRNGPFIDESDSEEDLQELRDLESPLSVPGRSTRQSTAIDNRPSAARTPPLVREATSHAGDDEFAVFDDTGESGFLDQPWEFEEARIPDVSAFDAIDDYTSEYQEDYYGGGPEEDARVCPICQFDMSSLNEAEITVHVNDCLDGKETSTPTTAGLTATPAEALSRMERAAIPRPAQKDPFTQKSTGTASAFSKLMAGNAEDTAWAVAAANEVSSRGKQAYQRTCPFYKIIPGFSICVDAFRYGAVEGCNAYFLSHFHSDHYIGLTSSWCHGPIYCSKVTGNLVRQQLRVDPKWVVDIEFEKLSEVAGTGGVHVTMIPANHCPGSSLFLFEKSFGQGPSARKQRILHCGDFRACPAHVQHPLLRPLVADEAGDQARPQRIDVCYLDTTYLSPKYAFPSQEDVISACAELCVNLNNGSIDGKLPAGDEKNEPQNVNSMSKFLSTVTGKGDSDRRFLSGGRLLVVIGTYSIGKERICIGIARALGCKIFATPQKRRICACLEDPELSSLLTDDPHQAQIHMQNVFEIRADTLADYLDSMKPHFSRIVGFRPTGWTYRPPAGRVLDNPPVSSVLNSDNWKTPFSVRSMTPQRGSTRESLCFGVPYSEHSSFRELTMFCCALHIGRVIPTVNVGNATSRDKMKAWFERWDAEKRKNGLFQVTGDSW
ncbi:hypothetical protein ASPZODRAFT_2077702 [Penicilliopsis zonata CBS 506.65]|uniref:DNA repair metallo-beta-lactamase domain-containing protein n=1 Tax=Penicilliopsis zonata CBS 506.65 TaxID=1073090 RepID=A0A1L9SG63_9EURO|nr:hypothetical protein ASPZODRAFT_2077702 [Penicilliopsis zonata CBS 506.65]OJJ46230.1 hypothetical protein ASPZODRAFT_2077702 [Penicilliopsis zonata CBS 506.65]